MRTTAIVTWMLFLTTLSAEEPTVRDVPFATVGGRQLKLDLYLPTQPGSQSSACVVWVHGGAWKGGSKSDVPVAAWVRHGLAIASIDYRLSPEAPFPAQVHDIKAAVRFLRANASRYNLRSDQIAIAGSSAGGHLAALVGVSTGVAELEDDVGAHLDQSSEVGAIVSFYGASNLQTILSQSTEFGLSVRVPALQLLLRGQPGDKPELARLASPVAHIDARDPPCWLIHGDADPQMPFEQSVEFKKACEASSVQVRLDVVAGGKHGGAEFFQASRLEALAKEISLALEDRAARSGQASLPKQ